MIENTTYCSKEVENDLQIARKTVKIAGGQR